ncbi:acyl carrier protein [Actinomyces minihominis]|uniref:acyl carrier protein n=1 Tax=Actinomyces minihominis TaxID=2002838 RepID=UPI000C070473|nr:acyl carrier protein [Actinomyces minihominis]
MSTIGDQFGALAALFGGDGEASPSSAPQQVEVVEDESVEAAEGESSVSGEATFASTLIATICELNGMSAEDFDFDASLADELDIQGLPLWALVAELERFAGAKFPDPVVEAWRTPRDILSSEQD